MKCIYAICNFMPIYKSWDYFFLFFCLVHLVNSTRLASVHSAGRGPGGQTKGYSETRLLSGNWHPRHLVARQDSNRSVTKTKEQRHQQLRFHFPSNCAKPTF